MKANIKKRSLSTLRGFMATILMMGAALLAFSPSASAYRSPLHLSWWTNSMYNIEYLQVDYTTNDAVPYIMSFDQGFWCKGVWYRYYHSYYVYENGGFHTYYMYVR